MRYIPTLMLTLVSWLSHAEPLAAIKDSELTKILTNFELLAQTPESAKMSARVLRVLEHGECDGSQSTCPQSTLYIAVSEYAEFPEQKLYQLPQGHNWQFLAWVDFPKTPNPPSYLVLKAKLQIPSNDSKKPGWVDEIYTITVNYQDGSWTKHR